MNEKRCNNTGRDGKLEAEHGAVDIEKISAQERYSLEDFLELIEPEIETSRQLWQEVAMEAKLLTDSEESVVALVDRFQEKYDFMETNQAITYSRNLLGRVAKHSLILARYLSSPGNEESIPDDIDPGDQFEYLVSQYTTIDDDDTYDLLQGVSCPYIMSHDCQLDMAKKMKEADHCREKVIESLIHFHEENSNFLADLQESFAIKGCQSPELSELQHIISNDLAIDDSILQSYLEWFEENPKQHIDDFSVLILKDEKPTARTSDYVRFALLSVDREMTPQAVSDIVSKTFAGDSWQDFPQLRKEYDRFVGKRMAALEKQIRTLAQPIKSSDMRLPRIRRDVVISQAALMLDSTKPGGRHERRKRRKSIEEIQNIELKNENPDDFEKEKPPQKLKIIQWLSEKDAKDNAKLIEVNKDELIESLSGKMRDGNGYEEDARKIVDYLLDNPINPGMKRLQTADKYFLKINGRRYNPMRFRPDRAAGFGKINDNQLRAAYAIVGGDIVIYDILPHADFDKKF